MQADIRILLIGDEKRPEFAPVGAWLAKRNAVVVKAPDEALTRIHAGFAPTIIVVAQPWPGHVSSKQIELLRQAAPLARIVSLLGTWLEGEARTGKPWPAVWRTYWHQWLPRLVPQLEHLAAGEDTVLAIPLTAGDDERVLHLCPQNSGTSNSTTSQKTIAVVSSHRQVAEALGDICRQSGWQTAWMRFPTDNALMHADLFIYDCHHLNSVEIDRIANFKSQISNPNSQFNSDSLIVLAGFPRIEDVQQLQSAGVTAVVSKPFFTSELLWQINQALAM